MKLISGSANKPLAKEIADFLDIELVETELTQFANSENRVWVKGSVQDETVVLLQSFSQPTDKHLVEFLLLADAIERAGAEELIAVIPWLGYSLQDKVFRPGEPISAKVVANMISASFAKRILLLDLHNSSIPGFFSKPTIHLSAMQLLADHVKSLIDDPSRFVVASPDFGGLKRAFVFSQALNLPLVKLDKRRDLHTREIVSMGLNGDQVKDKTVFIFDDVILSGGTVMEAASLLKQAGASKVIFLATHGLFVADAKEKLNQSEVDQVVVTNSIKQADLPEKIRQVSVARLIAQAIKK